MWASPPQPVAAGDDAPWHRSRRAARSQGDEGLSNGATPKAPVDALAAASAKQPAIVTTMSKSMAMPSLPALPAPAPVAPWHKTSPLPAPPWRSATLPAPPAKSSAPWQGLANRTAPISPAASPNGLTSLADRVAGVLGPAAGSTPQADVLPLAEYRSRLVTIYTMHNPSNVAKIDYLLSKYKGQEQLLYDSVCQKYQISRSWDGRQPLLPGSANAVPSNSSTGLPSLAALSLVQPSETQHKEQAAQPGPVNGGGKITAAPPWARKALLPHADLSKSESKEAKRPAASKTEEADDDLFEVDNEAALAALQSLTQDLGEPTRVPKKLKPAPEIPSAKGMAKLDYFLIGEKTGFFSDEETVDDLFDAFSDVDSDEEDAKAKHQATELHKETEEKEEKTPPTAEPAIAEAPKSPAQEAEDEEKAKKDEEKQEEQKEDMKEPEDIDHEEEREKSPILAQPVMPPDSSELQKEELRKEEERKRRVRKPPTPPRAPRRKLPQPKAGASAPEAQNPAPPAANPQGVAPEDDDDEVVVLSVSAGDRILNPVQDEDKKEEKSKEKEPEEKKEQEPASKKRSLEEMAAEDKDQGMELEDAKLGEQMRAALGASLARQVGNDPRLPEQAPAAPTAAPPQEPSKEEKKRLAAAAAAARGLASKTAEASDSESDSESYSQSSDEEDDADEEGDTGNARANGDRSVRNSLLGEIFQDLQDFSGTPGRATMKAMQRFVTMVGFEGSDNEWRAEYVNLCKEWQVDPDLGFDKEAFAKMCNDNSDAGCYCKDHELRIILNKLISAPKRVEAKKRKAPAAEDSPEKRQKAEIAFQ